MNILKNLFTVALIFVGGVSLSAQTFSVQASIDSIIIYIGEQTKLSFEVIQPRDAVVTMPTFDRELQSGLEALESVMDTVLLDDNRQKVRQTLTLTSFDSALYYIPPYAFVLSNDTVFSNSLSLKVVTVHVDTTQFAIADIKPVVRPPFNWKFFFSLLGLMALAGAIISIVVWWLIRLWKKPKVAETVVKPVIRRSPTEVALEALENLREEKPWQNGRVKIYYTLLTDVLRTYIEGRYAMPTFERTSTEILESLSFLKNEQADACRQLQQIFKISDLVKFAKMQPELNDHLRCLAAAVDFVKTTDNTPQSGVAVQTVSPSEATQNSAPVQL
ncbi:MAG: cell wall anchor protein [Prevotellaceae bacterium]|jgi:hypothetical protein|nr:cell wall anchor protein [Prevotellaceae bacterium]